MGWSHPDFGTGRPGPGSGAVSGEDVGLNRAGEVGRIGTAWHGVSFCVDSLYGIGKYKNTYSTTSVY